MAKVDEATSSETHDAQHLKVLTDLGKQVQEAKEEMERLHEQHKNAKKLYENLDSRLQKCSVEKLDLWDNAEEAWREQGVIVLVSYEGITEKAIAKMIDGGIKTVGQIADHTSASSKLVDLPGVTKGNQSAFEDALEQFFADNNIGDDSADADEVAE